MTVHEPPTPGRRAAHAGTDACRRPRRRAPQLPMPTAAAERAARAGAGVARPAAAGAARRLRARGCGGASASPWSSAAIVVGCRQLGACRPPTCRRRARRFTELRRAAGRPVLRQRAQRQGHRPAGCGSRCSGCSRASRWPRSSASRFGLLIGASRRAWKALNPVVQLLRPVSPLAWFPIWLIVFRDAGKAAVWVIFVTALWPIVLNTAAGAAAVPARPARRRPGVPVRAAGLPAPRAHPRLAARRSSPACGCRWASPGW